MSPPDEAIEKREKELENRIQMLEKHLERLSAHISEEESPSPTATPPVARQKPQQINGVTTEEMPELSEEVLGWASRNALLPRLATVCFLMVIALILRTVTDSGLVGKLPGSAIGMCYAAGLMAFAWFKYSEKSPLAPVFSACGVVLMSSIVVETHMHFKSLPLVPAYLTLMATGLAMALMSRRFNAFTPISVGVLGMCFAGAAIDYPRPFFPYLALVLYTANVLGYGAAQLKRCSWLRWSVLVVTMIMLQLWGIRLGLLLSKKEIIPPELAPDWYLPVLAVFFMTFILLSLLGIFKTRDRKISRFDFSLPTINVIWAFTLARHVVEARQMNMTLFGSIALIVSVALFGVAFWCARRKVEGAPGTNTFAVAGAALLALALPVTTGAFVMSLPVISLVAISMAVLSRIAKNGGIRGTSYVLTIYASVALVLTLRGDSPGVNDPLLMLPAGLIAFISIYHFQWCRWFPVPADSALFDFCDRNDRSAVLLLLGGLISGFIVLKIALFQALPFISDALQRDSFRCGQSVLINGAVVILIVLAYIRQDKELRNVAILITVIGAIKVFLYDLLGTHGLPLVFSVFSFGVAAAVESIALSKWQKQPAHQMDNEEESADALDS